ncbi:MAG: pyocin knob domain-containing protein [Pseudomonadota bacterium]
MTALPAATAFTASTVTEGGFKTALNDLRSYLSSLLGNAGTVAEAAALLGIPFGAVLTRTAATTLTTANRGVLVDASGTWALTLPTVAAAGPGWTAIVRNGATGTITLTRAGSDTIDGATSVALLAGRTVMIVATATGWLSFALAGSAGGALRLPPGAVGAPALALGGAATGLFSPLADQVAAAINGVQALLLTATYAQLDVPLIGTAVMQTAYDATPLRLARVQAAGGLFGWGVTSAPGLMADLDVTTEPSGLKRIDATTLGPRPTGWSGAAGYVTTQRQNTGNIIQTLTGTSGALVAWQRRYSAAVWGAWTPVQQPTLGTVSQTSGAPTGALIERGASANGEYVRFADGTQICTQTLTASASAGVVWTYPAAFIAAPVVTGTAVATVLSCPTLDAAPGTTTATLSARDKVDARRADALRVMAVGRWF